MSQIEHKLTPKLGRYDFDGACAPHNNPHGNYHNFTLGIFEWEAKSGGKGLKRGKILVRVMGETANPEPAYFEARDRCALLNNEPRPTPSTPTDTPHPQP